MSLFDRTDEWAIVEALVQAYRLAPDIDLEDSDAAFDAQVNGMIPVLLDGDELRDRKGNLLHTVTLNGRTFTRSRPHLAASSIRFVAR